jgi:hypothetical protein
MRLYLTVTPELRREVSRSIREDFDNERHYDAPHGHRVRAPEAPGDRPAVDVLRWHNADVYLG